MQIPLHELSIPVPNKRICEYMPKEFLRLRWDDDIPGERYPTYVKLAGFRSQLKESHVSSHTEELWYHETVCL